MLILGLNGLMGSLKKSVKVGNKRSTFVVETVFLNNLIPLY